MLLFLSCDSVEDSTPTATVFGGTGKITLSSPGDEQTVSGNIPFVFDSGNAAYICVTIFAKPPTVSSDDSISNWDDCVGGIRSGMDYFYRGRCFLEDMRTFNLKKMDFNRDIPLILTEGETYYWIVWGMNKEGLLEKSSPLYLFHYSSLP